MHERRVPEIQESNQHADPEYERKDEFETAPGTGHHRDPVVRISDGLDVCIFVRFGIGRIARDRTHVTAVKPILIVDFRTLGQLYPVQLCITRP